MGAGAVCGEAKEGGGVSTLKVGDLITVTEYGQTYRDSHNTEKPQVFRVVSFEDNGDIKLEPVWTDKERA